MSVDRTLEVHDKAGLSAAIAAATGGETILLSGGDYGDLSLSRSFSETLTIRSADAEDPAIFTGLTLRNAAGIAFEQITFDRPDTPGLEEWRPVVELRGARDIAFTATTFLGSDQVDGEDPLLDGYPTGAGLAVRDSARIVVTDSSLSNFWTGVQLVDSRDVIFARNEITAVRVDGMSLQNVENVLIEDNHMHGFDRFTSVRSDGDVDHSDMIQMFSVTDDASEVSQGVTIRGNTMDLGDDGAWSQGIWITNHNTDSRGRGAEYLYQDIVIEENVIVNDRTHGIHVGGTDGVRIANNTLLHSPTPGHEDHNGSSAPKIFVSTTSTDVSIVRNVGQFKWGFEPEPDWVFTDNVVVERGLGDKPGQYGSFLLDAGDLTDAPDNLTVLPGTEIHALGAGATRLLYDPTPESVRALAQTTGDGNAFTFDAGLSAGPTGPAAAAGASFLWDFGDGTTATGAQVSHLYADGGVYTVTLEVVMPDGSSDTFSTERAVDGGDLLRFDEATGTILTEHVGTEVALPLDLPLTATADGTSALALGQSPVEIPPAALDGLAGALSFHLGLDLRLADSPGAGDILKIPGLLSLSLTEAGALSVTLVHGGLNHSVDISPAGLDDGDWHRVSLDYDGSGGGLLVRVDGAPAAEIDVTGKLGDPGDAALWIGGGGSDGVHGELRGLDLDALGGSVLPAVAESHEDASAAGAGDGGTTDVAAGEVEPGAAVTGHLEAGVLSVTQADRDTWHSVTFSQTIADARVVMGPPSADGADPAVVRVRNVTDSGFEFQIEEWQYLDGTHSAESVGWLAMSAGTHRLADGSVLSAGRIAATDHDAVAVDLSGFSDAPSVFAQISSDNGGQTVAARLSEVDRAGFAVAMQEEERLMNGHTTETVDWIAVTRADGGVIAGGTVSADHSGATIATPPIPDDFVFIAAMQTAHGSDTAALRHVHDAGSAELRVFVEEEASADTETWHTMEQIDYALLGSGTHDLFAIA